MIDAPLVIETRGGVQVVSCREDTCLDAPLVQLVQDDLHALLDPDAPRDVLIDLGHATFVSSPALTMLIHLRRAAQALERRVVLAGLQPQVRRLFAITRLDVLFEIHATPAEALLAWADGAAAPGATAEPIET